ncbi:MAG TPA: hypothetical protein VK999_05710 [Methylotenera sp.]|nr:hypothetical protein [Methylotenera sp.]
MNSAFFRQHLAAIQAQLRQSQSGSWLKRLLVWLMLGVLMVFSLAALLFLLLLSWLLIPLMIYRTRRMMRRQQQTYQQQSQPHREQHDNVIEGEIVDRDQHR